MSMSIQRAKYTGDPGWGWLGKIAKVGLGVASMVPGVGGIARTISSAVFRPAPGTTTYAQMPLGTNMPRVPQGMPGSGASYLADKAIDCRGSWSTVANRLGVSVSRAQTMCASAAEAPGPLAAIQRALPGGQTGLGMVAAEEGQFGVTTAMMAGKPTGWPGYHWNKSGYFLLTGEYVAPGTKAVRNRRRNPANPRATSNAIMRLKGAKRYAKSLSAISIRKKC